MIPGTICGGYLSQRLLAKGYSVGTTRKILETICMGTEMMCLIIIGEILLGGLVLSAHFLSSVTNVRGI